MDGARNNHPEWGNQIPSPQNRDKYYMFGLICEHKLLSFKYVYFYLNNHKGYVASKWTWERQLPRKMEIENCIVKL